MSVPGNLTGCLCAPPREDSGKMVLVRRGWVLGSLTGLCPVPGVSAHFQATFLLQTDSKLAVVGGVAGTFPFPSLPMVAQSPELSSFSRLKIPGRRHSSSPDTLSAARPLAAQHTHAHTQECPHTYTHANKHMYTGSCTHAQKYISICTCKHQCKE